MRAEIICLLLATNLYCITGSLLLSLLACCDLVAHPVGSGTLLVMIADP